ncbi:MAG: hypothetical protein JWM68_956 [Verrucomicrobiales bacterium]|nr:hypothetical protein [Verrucomicrobiales bacterium]
MDFRPTILFSERKNSKNLPELVVSDVESRESPRFCRSYSQMSAAFDIPPAILSPRSRNLSPFQGVADIS